MAALTQKCTNKASKDHWWDLKGLIYERISVMFFWGEIWQPRDQKKGRGGRGIAACHKYNGFCGGKTGQPSSHYEEKLFEVIILDNRLEPKKNGMKPKFFYCPLLHVVKFG
jgi:hypothetical protein